MSTTSKKWEIKSSYPDDIVGAILKGRKLEAAEFFGNDYNDLDKLAQLDNLPPAKKLIEKYKKGKIVIYCDYDVDGICGGAILYRILRRKKYNVGYYIPLRRDGYGMNKKAIDKIADDDVDLIITVDCGIRDIEEVKYAQEKGIEVIITDHHKVGKKVPDCLIIHPSLGKSRANLKLSGGGVAFMLGKEILENENVAKWFLDLAALSTFADMVELIGANRIIAKYGLIVLNQTKNFGLISLIKYSELSLGDINEYHIGFVLAPKINASGRLEDPKMSFELLVTDDKCKADEIAKYLVELNQKRQRIVGDFLAELVDKVHARGVGNLIYEINENYQEGILGLISGKITEKFYRPSIIFSLSGDKLRGSARSISGIDITNLFAKHSHLLDNYGGHSMAAGLSLNKKNLEKFVKLIEADIGKLGVAIFDRVVRIDVLIRANQINMKLVGELETMQPFGIGNPRPVLMLEDVAVSRSLLCGRDKNHQQLTISGAGGELEAILFNIKENGMLEIGKQYDIAFNLQKEIFRSRNSIKAFVRNYRTK
ncbi:single-stranded-DNA-specific exonuclease RecJ [Candidatus Berkelbacteria bacterium CG10_big_fil_rev_8_21_14_0_10_41_12]|uniref:Single-stranded-DNA-specific exonuclease RecJ n=1 Tax=Candidatus Berkelbacteria bacterium CG10_big_fil_rev_8_21_14_0_10_41_12 TaxID=1974513 RepID=A0A2M6WX04_9BACT|nr:MAG: single-stranded-DNA-specific exonuclease RecJ [Candidatus Berkelbacteria bacterium CG10_big_fil_rev_8_21_14_0_10_41_12]